MKRTQSEKYVVAWDKLAECISMREKERALGVYRLLSHSFGNPAAQDQLEGDILLTFNDQEGAIKGYEKAAALYEGRGEYAQAVAMYNQLFLITTDYAYPEKVIALYVHLEQPAQMLVYLRHLCLILLRKDLQKLLVQLFDSLCMSDEQFIEFISELVYVAIADPMISHIAQYRVVHYTLDLIKNDVARLQAFSLRLKSIDEHYYQEACAYVQSV